MTTAIQGESKQQTVPKLQPLPTRSGQQILLADSDPQILESLTASLTRQGYTVATAGDGPSTLRMANCQPTNLIILDDSLPGADGMDLCAQLTDAPETCEIPVILLSNDGNPEIVRQARAAGCKYFLRKPFDPNVLLVLIETALRVRKEIWTML